MRRGLSSEQIEALANAAWGIVIIALIGLLLAFIFNESE